jgi:hypothetical protein
VKTAMVFNEGAMLLRLDNLGDGEEEKIELLNDSCLISSTFRIRPKLTGEPDRSRAIFSTK